MSARNKLWLIDDGVRHSVLAPTKAMALAIYIENLIDVAGEWPSEQPDIEEIESTKKYSLDTQGPLGKVEIMAADWCQLITAPQYLGCSEY